MNEMFFFHEDTIIGWIRLGNKHIGWSTIGNFRSKIIMSFFIASNLMKVLHTCVYFETIFVQENLHFYGISFLSESEDGQKNV